MTDWAEFQKKCNVSRETIEKLEVYAQLLRKWNKAINLVAPSTIPQLWMRHFLDSAQILGHTPNQSGKWVDVGSGAGFPGLIVACLAPEIEVICIESDQRKSVFLQTVIRELNLNAKAIPLRIEQVEPSHASTLTARALAPIGQLLTHTERHLVPEGRAIFLKGSGHLREIRQAQSEWMFDIKTFPSKTDPEGVILILEDIRRA